MNILITSIGRRSYLVDYFKNAIGSNGRIIATNSKYTNSLSRADKWAISPIIYSDEYIPFILDLCKKNRVRAILSCFDIDLPVLAKNKELFAANGTTFVGPSYETALIGNDKLKTYEFFKETGLKSPATYFCCDEVLDLLDCKELGFPLVIKPRWGMGSIALYIARTQEELVVLYKKSRYEIENSYLKYESLSDMERSVVIQEFIEGQEYGLDIYKDLSGNYVSANAKKKVAMRSGETDIGETVYNKIFNDSIEALAKNLDFTGILSFDCFLSGETVYGIEINPRISGHYPFSHIAGARYPEQLIRWLKGEETDPALLTAKVGVRGCKEISPTVMKFSNSL